MASRDWDWTAKNESVVVPSVQAVAVYTNPSGNIVIRQQDAYGDEDSVIVIPRSVVIAIAEAMKAEAAKPFDPEDDDAL